MQKDYFKLSNINIEDPDNLDEFYLATTISDGLIAEEVSFGIHVIHNALTLDELKYLNDLCRTATQEDWEAAYKDYDYSKDEESVAETYRNYWYDKSMHIEDRDFCLNLVNRIKPFFGDGYDLPVMTILQRQRINEGMDEHCDMGSRSSLLRSMLFYINDDYEGGELYFPALDFEYKPKPGDFITFPSYEKYTHGVRPVLSGSDRYVLAGFAWAAGSYLDN